MSAVFLVSLLLLYTCSCAEAKSWPARGIGKSLSDISTGALHGGQVGRSYTPRSNNRLDDDISSEEHLGHDISSEEHHMHESIEDSSESRRGVYAGGCPHPNHRIIDIARSSNLISGLLRKSLISKLPRTSKVLQKSRDPITIVWEESTPARGANFRREFETSNGIHQAVMGYEGEAGQANMRGLFSWPLSAGRAFFTYEADENGYRVESPQLPVAPENPYPMPEHSIQQIRFAQQQKFQGITFDLQGNAIYPKNWSPSNIRRPQQQGFPIINREADGFTEQSADGSSGVGISPTQWGNIWEPQLI